MIRMNNIKIVYKLFIVQNSQKKIEHTCIEKVKRSKKKKIKKNKNICK